MEPESSSVKSASAKIKKEIGRLKEADVIVHHNADPDAIGSAIALARGLSQFGVKTAVVAPKDISRQSESLLKKYPYPIEKEPKTGRNIFIIDSSSPEQVPVEIPKDAFVALIDHHEPGALAKRADVALVQPDAHSTASIVLSVLENIGAELSREIKFFLLAGIIADTGFLRYASREDLKTVLSLSEDIPLEDVYSALTVPEDVSERIAKLQAAKRAELYRIGDYIMAFSGVGSFESQSALSLMKAGADVAIVFNVQKDEIRISGRMRSSMPKAFDLADAFTKISGIIKGGAGGHRTAASANGKDIKSMEPAKNALLSYFEKALSKNSKRIV